jgi:rRNA-processing protein FCF1
MLALRLSLKPGVSPAQAAEGLRPHLIRAGNVNVGAGSSELLRDRYLEWVEEVELQLAGITHDPEILSILQSRRYWHIRDLDERSARPFPLVRAELELQLATLTRLVDDLERRAQTLSAAPGHVAVLDTNVLLHYLPVMDIPWRDVVQQRVVRLVVPLRVIEELDAKKYSRRADLADRARRLLPQLESFVGAGGEPGEVRPGTTLEVPADTGLRNRPTDADQEILAVCNELQQLVGRPVSLISGDTAMRLRAHSQGIAVLKMPEEYRRGGSSRQEPAM